MQTNVDKRKQSQRRTRKQAQANASKKSEQPQTNAYTPLSFRFLTPPLRNPLIQRAFRHSRVCFQSRVFACLRGTLAISAENFVKTCHRCARAFCCEKKCRDFWCNFNGLSLFPKKQSRNILDKFCEIQSNVRRKFGTKINSVQTRCIVTGEAQKSPLFWRFSGGF